MKGKCFLFLRIDWKKGERGRRTREKPRLWSKYYTDEMNMKRHREKKIGWKESIIIICTLMKAGKSIFFLFLFFTLFCVWLENISRFLWQNFRLFMPILKEGTRTAINKEFSAIFNYLPLLLLRKSRSLADIVINWNPSTIWLSLSQLDDLSKQKKNLFFLCSSKSFSHSNFLFFFSLPSCQIKKS